MFDPGKLGEMMRQAQEAQDRMQRELRDATVEGVAGGGMVKLAMNGLYEVISVRIDPAVVDKADVGLLEDLVRAAVGQACARVEELRVDNARKMAGAFGLPGGMF